MSHNNPKAAILVPAYGVEAVQQLQPLIFPYEFEPIYIAIDFENTQLRARHGRLLDFQSGLSVLDTRDLHLPANQRRDVKTIIKTHNYVCGSPEYFKKAADTYVSGDTLEHVPSEQMLSKIDGHLKNKSQRDIILVGHALSNDLEVLKNMGFDFEASSIVTYLDTQMVQHAIGPRHNQAQKPRALSSLKALVQFYDLPAEGHYHNAGNDAKYTMRVLCQQAHSAHEKSLIGRADIIRIGGTFILPEANSSPIVPLDNYMEAPERNSAKARKRNSGAAVAFSGMEVEALREHSGVLARQVGRLHEDLAAMRRELQVKDGELQAERKARRQVEEALREAEETIKAGADKAHDHENISARELEAMMSTALDPFDEIGESADERRQPQPETRTNVQTRSQSLRAAAVFRTREHGGKSAGADEPATQGVKRKRSMSGGMLLSSKRCRVPGAFVDSDSD